MYVVNHMIYGYKVAFLILNGFSNVVLEHQVNHELDILILAAKWEIPQLLRCTPSGLSKLAFGSPSIIIFEWSLVRVPIELLSNKHIVNLASCVILNSLPVSSDMVFLEVWSFFFQDSHDIFKLFETLLWLHILMSLVKGLLLLNLDCRYHLTIPHSWEFRLVCEQWL